jgi:hypothetical protein
MCISAINKHVNLHVSLFYARLHITTSAEYHVDHLTCALRVEPQLQETTLSVILFENLESVQLTSKYFCLVIKKTKFLLTIN